MRVAVGYLRVSTDEQHLGPEAQRAAIEAWAAREGFSVPFYGVDHGVGGAAPIDKREGLLGALERVREAKASVLVVAKRDRLARDVIAAAMIERMVGAACKGARVVSADGVGEGEGPESALMRRMVDAFAEYERALISARTRAALGARKRKGLRISGRAPFGFRFDDAGQLVPVPCETAAALRVRHLAAQGITPGAIASRLEAEGFPPRGARWHRNTVRRILEALAGDSSPLGSQVAGEPLR